jgi:hypothetical protein
MGGVSGGSGRPAQRRLARQVGAALAGVMALVYYLVGAGVITVAEAVEGEMDIVVFGVGAGTIFLVGAALLLTVDRRPVWAVGAVLQVLIMAMYLAVSADRTPAFEAWGIGLRLVQVVLLAVLVYLAVTPSRAVTQSASTSATASRAPTGLRK